VSGDHTAYVVGDTAGSFYETNAGGKDIYAIALNATTGAFIWGLKFSHIF